MSKVKKLQYSTFYVRYSFLTRRSCRGYNSREKAAVANSRCPARKSAPARKSGPEWPYVF